MNNYDNFELNDILIQLEKIDYNLIVQSLSPIIIAYAGFKIEKNYSLYKDYKTSNDKILLPPPITDVNLKLDFENMLAKKYSDAILNFAKLIINNFSPENLLIFYKNINKLVVETKDFTLEDTHLNIRTIGRYNISNNTISIDDAYSELSIYHELFHMSSSFKNNGIVFSGFKQGYIKNNQKICNGVALNEGYTQFLTDRYFGKGISYVDGYYWEKSIACNLEKIVGQKKMEHLYLNANLQGLIVELSQYASNKEIMDFITKFDFLTIYQYDQNPNLVTSRMILNSLKTVNEFLLKCYAIKNARKFNDGLISLKQFNNNLIKYIHNLGDILKVGNKEYQYLTKESYKQIVDEALNVSVNNNDKIL